MSLHWIDWTVVGTYLVCLIALSAWLARGQRSGRDYYLAGNNIGALPIALSTAATQCSTNSLLGAPAFVAFGGGFLWLQYELAVPFAMILLMLVLFPVFRGLRLVSLYEYLEMRFGRESRVLLAVAFMLLRAFATGVTVYGISLTLGIVFNIPFWVAVLVLGVFTIIYDVLGGMRAVIWSDVLQLGVLFGAIVFALVLTVDLAGGWSQVWSVVEPQRLQALDFSGHGLGDGVTYGFWPMFIGGLFLYLAYYGCDQTQAQRELSTRSLGETRRALFWDGMIRFPLVLTYCLLGVGLAAYVQQHPEFVSELSLNARGEPDYNLAVPAFALRHFPVGVLGLFLVGLFAAAMSSIDSTLNALSAVTMRDVVERFFRPSLSERAEFFLAKGFTALWGALCLVLAFQVENIADTVIESVNKIGSLLNGPLLAVFLLGILTRRVGQAAALAGFGVGFSINLSLWVFWEEQVSWLWWNVIGCLAAVAVALTVSAWRPATDVVRDALRLQPLDASPRSRAYMAVLFGYGIAIFCLLASTLWLFRT